MHFDIGQWWETLLLSWQQATFADCALSIATVTAFVFVMNTLTSR